MFAGHFFTTDCLFEWNWQIVMRLIVTVSCANGEKARGLNQEREIKKVTSQGAADIRRLAFCGRGGVF